VSKPLLMNGASRPEGEGLMAVGLRAEKRTQLVEQTTEARRRGAMFEPAYWPIPLCDPTMILLQMVIQGASGSMRHPGPEHRADRTGVGVMAIRREAVRHHGFCCDFSFGAI
jgi:hypothetical protein